MENLIGKIFNRWKVIDYAPPKIRSNGRKSSCWLCECTCPLHTIKVVNQNSLKAGTSKSCGCLNRELASKRMKEYRKKEKKEENRLLYDNNGVVIKKRCTICYRWLSLDNFWSSKQTLDGHSGYCIDCGKGYLNKRYQRYKTRAKNVKGIKFELTKQQFDIITSQPCFYCGSYSDFYFGKGYTGIDRIDSNLGYIEDNMVPCCELCNQIKNNLTLNAFKEKVTKIYNNYKEGNII